MNENVSPLIVWPYWTRYAFGQVIVETTWSE